MFIIMPKSASFDAGASISERARCLGDRTLWEEPAAKAPNADLRIGSLLEKLVVRLHRDRESPQAS